jgi:hypothetical protein
MDKLSFTLYEIFGYFLPGAVGMLALAILFWAIFLPTTPLPVATTELSKLWYFGLIVLSYYAGHVLQAISRSMFKNPDDSLSEREKTDMLPVLKLAQKQIASHLGMKESEMPSDSATARLCDAVAVQHGQLGDRDVFVYREGFYRGSFAAFILLDLALMVRCIVPGAALHFAKHDVPVPSSEWAFAIVVVTTSIIHLFQRYKHFAALRVMHGVLAFVGLLSFPSLGVKAKGSNAKDV